MLFVYFTLPCSSHISGETGLYLRDVILGLNDGLVSMFLLLLGISGGGVKATEVHSMQCSLRLDLYYVFHFAFLNVVNPTGVACWYHRRCCRRHQHGSVRIHRSESQLVAIVFVLF